MGALIERFRKPLPTWQLMIKQEVECGVTQSPLIQECRKGDRDALEQLIIRFWPLVKQFPDILEEIKMRMLLEPFKHINHIDLARVLWTARRTLKEIKGNEIGHRELWIATAEELGVFDEMSAESESPEQAIRELCVAVAQKTHPAKMFLHLAAVRIVAEKVGSQLKEVFRVHVSPWAGGWFYAQVENRAGVMTHEQLLYHLAFAFGGDMVDQGFARLHINEVVTCFIKAGWSADDDEPDTHQELTVA